MCHGVAFTTPLTHNISMQTIVETPVFQRLWPYYWMEEERGEFAAYLAEHPEAGDVVRESGGCRKIRWRRKGAGKSGGVRVIYFNRLSHGQTVLLFLYAKNQTETIAAKKLQELKDAIEAIN